MAENKQYGTRSFQIYCENKNSNACWSTEEILYLHCFCAASQSIPNFSNIARNARLLLFWTVRRYLFKFPCTWIGSIWTWNDSRIYIYIYIYLYIHFWYISKSSNAVRVLVPLHLNDLYSTPLGIKIHSITSAPLPWKMRRRKHNNTVLNRYVQKTSRLIHRPMYSERKSRERERERERERQFNYRHLLQRTPPELLVQRVSRHHTPIQWRPGRLWNNAS